MQFSKWLVPAAIAALGCGSLISSTVSADTLLYTSNGFEASGGYVPFTQLMGQPAAASDPWDSFISTSGAGGANAFVQPYLNVAVGETNLQFAQVVGQNLTSGSDFAYYYPTTFSNTPYNAASLQIATRASMAFSSSASNSVVGLTGFSGADPLGIAAINGNGTIYSPAGFTLTPAGQSFVATQGAFYQFELLLDYASQTFSVYEAALNAPGFTLMGSGPFFNPATTFTDTDLTVVAGASINNATVTANGFFDNYTVSVVPEPAAAGIVAFGLLLLQRRRGSDASV